jgi:class 3 adenylate cyclase
MTENINNLKRDFNQPTQRHQDKEKTQSKVLEFFGKSKDCVVCLVDIVNSTKITAHIPESKLNLFYSTFLNGMAEVVKENNGKIVKSIGDALLYYFDASEQDYMRNALKCGLRMVEKRDSINGILNEKSIPPISYRVSGDFGKVMIGYSTVSSVEDIFGPAVNMCSKINPLVNSNGMVIGNDFHAIIKSSHDFQFSMIKQSQSSGQMRKYSVYEVKGT